MGHATRTSAVSKRLVARVSTVAAAAALAFTLAAGSASAIEIVRLYSHTAQGAQACNAAANAAGPGYFCKEHKIGSQTFWALARP